jgi:hypothetical protein
MNFINYIGSIDNEHYYSIFKIRDKWFEFNENHVILLNNIEKSTDDCAFLYEKYYKNNFNIYLFNIA